MFCRLRKVRIVPSCLWACSCLIYAICIYVRIMVSKRLDYMSNMAGVLQETRTAYPSRKLVFIPTSGGDLLVIFLVCFVLCCVFHQCLVCPMLPVSLDCPFLIATSVFSNAYLSCVLCVQCCQCLLIVQSWQPLLFSLTLICPVSCMPNVAGVSWLSSLDCHFCFL